jgi:hypothetical protein
MKRICAWLFLISALTGGPLHAQYQETFDTPNKGIIAGPCVGNDPTTCVLNDFSDVNWTIAGNLSGIVDAMDYFRTEAGAMTAVDVDQEVCWVSPELSVSGTASFSMDLAWIGYDDYNGSAVGSQDYIDVAYRLDGGAWLVLANAVGGGPRTVSYVGMGIGNDGSLTAFGASGLTGDTLQIRVCIDVNSANEITTIDNVAAINADLPGTDPAIELSTGAIDLGNVVVGQTSLPGALGVQNSGAGDLVVGQITLAGTHPGDFSVVSDSCSGQTLSTGASCALSLTATAAVLGLRTASLSIPSNDPGGTRTVDLQFDAVTAELFEDRFEQP